MERESRKILGTLGPEGVAPAGFAVSAGSACASGKMKASRVLAAMGVPAAVADGALRLSFGPETSDVDIDAFLAAFSAIAGRRRAA